MRSPALWLHCVREGELRNFEDVPCHLAAKKPQQQDLAEGRGINMSPLAPTLSPGMWEGSTPQEEQCGDLSQSETSTFSHLFLNSCTGGEREAQES